MSAAVVDVRATSRPPSRESGIRNGHQFFMGSDDVV